MAKRHERTLARKMTVQVLYQLEFSNEEQINPLADDFALPDTGALLPYAKVLIEGVLAHREYIDELLDAASLNWSVDRMPLVDKAIMRIATFEMLYADNIPVSVAINEAVELAKSFGCEDESARFANGILGRIARTECGVSEVDVAQMVAAANELVGQNATTDTQSAQSDVDASEHVEG